MHKSIKSLSLKHYLYSSNESSTKFFFVSETTLARAVISTFSKNSGYLNINLKSQNAIVFYSI